MAYRRTVLLAALALTTAGCASAQGAKQPASPANTPSTTTARTTTKATTPTNPAISNLMVGTAHPTIPPVTPGKVAILATGTPVSDSQSATVTVMVGNGTSAPISHVVVAVDVLDATGKVVETGGSVGFTPQTVAPGQVSFGYALFSGSAPVQGKLVPAGSKLRSTIVSFNQGATLTDVDAKMIQATLTGGQFTGSLTNPGPMTMSGSTVSVQAYCFDAKGTMTGEAASYADGTADLTTGAGTTFTIPLLEPPCPTFLVGAWGIAS